MSPRRSRKRRAKPEAKRRPEVRRPEVISRKVRRLFFYTIPEAGRMVRLKRSQSYRAVELGQMPAERHGKFLLVPKEPWDREAKRLMQGQAENRPEAEQLDQQSVA
jgi:hypothetical protein